MDEHEKYLLDFPTIRPYLETLLGRNYRLDHDYIKIDNAKHSYELYLHGGGQGADGASDLYHALGNTARVFSAILVCNRAYPAPARRDSEKNLYHTHYPFA